MDNEEDLLDDKHFEDDAEFDVDADTEKKLLGDDEDNVEYEYFDEFGKPVDINDNSEVEFVEYKDEDPYHNQSEQDVLDLEVDHDLEFDDSGINESTQQEIQKSEKSVLSVDQKFQEEENDQQNIQEEKIAEPSDDEESDDESEEAGRGRFRSERPNVVQLATRKQRANIPDSLDDVWREELRTGNNRQQRYNKRAKVDYNQRFDRNKQRDQPNRNYDSSRGGPQISENYSQNQGSSKEPLLSDNTWNNSQNYSKNFTGADPQSGSRKILINPHFKGSLPTSAEVPRQPVWNAESNLMNVNYNEPYNQNQQNLYSQNPYGASTNQAPDRGQGLLSVPNQMPNQMRPALLNPESHNSNEFQWNRNPYQGPPPPVHQPNMHQQNSGPGLIEQAPLIFPPPNRDQRPPILPNQYFNGNRPYQMRPPNQWNVPPPQTNFDNFNNFDGSPPANTWRPPPAQNSPLLSSPPGLQKFPDIRQPPPHMQMQHPPQPLMNFNNPPPNFSNMRADTSSNAWTPHQPALPMNNFSQLPPPLLGNQPPNIKPPGSMPFRLPLPTPNVPRYANTSLLGSPVVMSKIRPRNFHQFNAEIVRQENPNLQRPSNPTNYRIRPRLEDAAGFALKHQRPANFLNKQGNVVRRNPVNGNIKEVKIVDNLPIADKSNVAVPAIDNSLAEEEDEETKKYREKIEMLNKKRAEILRIKEERREIMARQRRKQWLEKNPNFSETNTDVVQQSIPSDDKVKNVQPNVLISSEVSPVTASTPVATSVKKRVIVLRRVSVTPRPPRIRVAPSVVNTNLVSAVPSTSTGSVAPGSFVTEPATVGKPLLRTVTNRIVSLKSDPPKIVQQPPVVKPLQQRQLRTVLLEDRTELVNPSKLTVNIQPSVSGQKPVKRVARMIVQSGGALDSGESRGMSNAVHMQTTVKIENLSLVTTEISLRNLCELYGPIQTIELKRETRTAHAVVKFVNSDSAKMFVERCQRRMVDMSFINLKLLSP